MAPRRPGPAGGTGACVALVGLGRGRAERLPARLDLLDYLAVTHIVTCDPIDHERFSLVEPLEPMYLYRNLTARPRALLTCAGEPLGAETVMRTLWRSAYDRAGGLIRRPPKVFVRWAPETGDGDRAAIERSLH